MPKLILFLIIVLQSNTLIFAQKLNKVDTVSKSTGIQSEATILYQKQLLDSLLKIQLISDIHAASGNNRRTKELEKKLKKIETEDSLHKLELLKKIESIRKNTKGSAVIPFNDTMFVIYTRIASYTPEDRSANITKRILKVYDDPFFNPDSINLIQTENGTDITYKSDLVIMAVTKLDAMLFNKDDFQLAGEYLDIIKKSIVEERKANSIANLLLRLGKVALIILGLVLLIYLINKLFGLINKFIAAKRERYEKGISVNKVRLLSPEHIEWIIMRLSGLMRIFVILVTIYLSLPLLFSIFPETKAWTTTLLKWILSPASKAIKGIIDFLPNFFSILVIYFLFKYSIQGIRYFVNQIDKGEIKLSGFHSDWAQPTFRILKFLLYAFMLVLIFPYLPGSGSPAFQGVSVFLGILFSLGSSSAIANIVAGMVITYMRPFKIGDRVKIGDITGDVMEKSLLVTRIRTPKNEDVTVPNSTVLLNSTTNFSTNTTAKNSGLIVHTTVTIGYDAPWKEVHKTLLEAAARTDLILKKPSPFVLQTSLDDFYVSYQLNGYTRDANIQARIYSQLHQNIQDCFNEAGIEIMSPHYRSQRDGNMITIPSDYHENNYEAPAFKIKEMKDKL